MELVLAETPSDVPVGEMTDSEMLRELVRNSRDVRDLVTKLIADVQASPLGAMLKGGGKVNLMSLLTGKM